jgi:hypothetical protein
MIFCTEVRVHVVVVRKYLFPEVLPYFRTSFRTVASTYLRSLYVSNSVCTSVSYVVPPYYVGLRLAGLHK